MEAFTSDEAETLIRAAQSLFGGSDGITSVINSKVPINSKCPLLKMLLFAWVCDFMLCYQPSPMPQPECCCTA